jgi:hypothetical protein
MQKGFALPFSKQGLVTLETIPNVVSMLKEPELLRVRKEQIRLLVRQAKGMKKKK